MCSPEIPPAPDYTGAANAQAAASKDLATQQNWANRPNQLTPWGRTVWKTDSSIDPATGLPVTSWTQQQTLRPQIQDALDQQLGLMNQRSDLAGSFMGRVEDAYNSPFNWQALPNRAHAPDATVTNTQPGIQKNIQQYQLDRTSPQQTTFSQRAPAFVAERQRIENALFDRMRPEHDRQEEQIRTMLINQGLTPGSEPYNQELKRQSELHAAERFNALQMGGSEQQRLHSMMMAQQQQAFGQDVASQAAFNQANMQQFGMGQQAGQFHNAANQQGFAQDLSANNQNFQQAMQESQYQAQLRQQAINEQMLRRNMPLNEMNALLTGQQVQSPNMPSFVPAQGSQAPQLLQAAMAQGNYGLNAAQMEAQADSQLWGNIGSMAGTAAMLFMMSDARLKTNARMIAWHRRGVPIYTYELLGRPHIGVMAQDLLEVAPELVAVHPSGYLMVNYGGL